MDYIFKSISNAKEMIERKPNQSTVDYKIYGVLTDCETIIKALHKTINGFTANATSVVRCKDCRFYKQNKHGEGYCTGTCDTLGYVDGDWFCADGKQKEGNEHG